MLYNQYAESQCFVMQNTNHKDLALNQVLVNVLCHMSLGWCIFLEGILKNGLSKSSNQDVLTSGRIKQIQLQKEEVSGLYHCITCLVMKYERCLLFYWECKTCDAPN